jgi:uncharacterized protein (TIGR03437 family)
MRTGKSALLFVSSLALIVTGTHAQSISGTCVVSAVPPLVRAEGLTERLGDVILQCSGANAGAVLSGNLAAFLPVNITNRVDANGLAADAVLSVDYGAGFVPTGISGQALNGSITYRGLNLTVPPGGSLSLKISNLRAAVNQLGGSSPNPIVASISFFVPISRATIIVGYAQAGLYATLSSSGITCVGSPVPSTIDMPSLFAAGTAFASTRVTEGFAMAFSPRAMGDDTGTRFLVQYSGFPANAHIFVPDLVAGYNALVPTAGGDLGLPQSAGQYVPGSGTLLLARVQDATASGAGGTPVFAPTGSGPVLLKSAREVSLINGSGFAVYEVVDSNNAVQESAQFPTFIGLSGTVTPAIAQESVSLAPVSNVTAASINAPFPRFASVTPASDCSILGDCGADYFPKLAVGALVPIQLTATAGGAMTSQPGYVPISNQGGGVMFWNVTVSYLSGSGWLTVDTPSGQDGGATRLWANAQNLAAGTYKANVVVDAGPLAGSVTIPVTLTVTAAPSAPPSTPPSTTPSTPDSSTPASVTVQSVVNAATFQAAPLVAGSLATVLGANLSGKNVSVTFTGSPATLLYTSATQINLVVPQALASKMSATMVVTVDGTSSTPLTVGLSSAWPAIFANGVLNQDNSVNSAGVPAAPGSILQIFATGVPAGVTVSVQMGARKDLVPLYAGASGDTPGVQQVNVAVPDNLPPGSTQVTVCAATQSQQYCSAAVPLTVQ